MNLPIPVFLVLADLELHKAYFVPVKDSIREKYADYMNKTTKNLSFKFTSTYEFGTGRGDSLFLAFYYIESFLSG